MVQKDILGGKINRTESLLVYIIEEVPRREGFLTTLPAPHLTSGICCRADGRLNTLLS